MKVEIYHLINPMTNEIVYVGQTALGIKQRVSNHMSNPINSRLSALVSELRNNKLKLRAEVIEVANLRTANSIEQKWIDQYRNAGIDLFNRKCHQPHTRNTKTNKMLFADELYQQRREAAKDGTK